MQYKELITKTALNPIKWDRLPFSWDLNIYRWCEHSCKYCYAIYSHNYINDKNFFDTIYYKNKKDLLLALEKQLSSPKWKWDVVNLWWVCDSYQPIEKELCIMRDVLKVFIKYKTPITISTKSDLILRDIDLLSELAEVAAVNIAFTIITMDENTRKILEPNWSPIQNRFKAMQEFKKTNCTIWVHLMPIIPYINDSQENIESILKKASEIWVNYVLPWFLSLRWKTREYFLNFIKSIPDEKYKKLYQLFTTKWKVPTEYRNEFYIMFWKLRAKYNIATRLSLERKKEYENVQMSLKI